MELHNLNQSHQKLQMQNNERLLRANAQQAELQSIQNEGGVDQSPPMTGHKQSAEKIDVQMVEIGAAHQIPRGKDLMEEQKVMSQHS